MVKNNIIWLKKPSRGCGSTKFLMKKIIETITQDGIKWFVFTITPHNIRDQLKNSYVEYLRSKDMAPTMALIDQIFKYVTIEKYDDSRTIGRDYMNSIVLLSDFDRRQNLHERVYLDLCNRQCDALIVEMDIKLQNRNEYDF